MSTLHSMPVYGHQSNPYNGNNLSGYVTSKGEWEQCFWRIPCGPACLEVMALIKLCNQPGWLKCKVGGRLITQPETWSPAVVCAGHPITHTGRGQGGRITSVTHLYIHVHSLLDIINSRYSLAAVLGINCVPCAAYFTYLTAGWNEHAYFLILHTTMYMYSSHTLTWGQLQLY